MLCTALSRCARLCYRSGAHSPALLAPQLLCSHPYYHREDHRAGRSAGVQAAAARRKMGRSKHRNKRPRLEPEVVPLADVAVRIDQYDVQLAAKAAKVRQMFGDMAIPELELFDSPREHFRQRAEFRVWQSRDDIFYIMYEKAEQSASGGAAAAAGDASPPAADGSPAGNGSAAGEAAQPGNDAAEPQDGGAGAEPEAAAGRRKWEKRRIDTFPVAATLVNSLMQAVIAGVRDVRELRHKLFQANFHSTLSGEAMVTLIYHRQLEDAWKEAALKLQAELGRVPQLALGGRVSVIGRSKSQKVILGEEFVTERLEVSGRTLSYRQVESGFSQPNGQVCRHMLEWALSVTAGSEERHLLELYCGNGNFTVALAGNFKSVFATEISKASVAAAHHNLEANGVANVHIARLSSEEFTQAWRGEREFFRMKELPDVKDKKFHTVLVDPPRAGLDDKTVELVRQIDNIVYVSCNPETLHANLGVIGQSHDIKRFALFDQFPYTDHIECGVYLTRKTSA